jgi:hypothetical protein
MSKHAQAFLQSELYAAGLAETAEFRKAALRYFFLFSIIVVGGLLLLDTTVWQKVSAEVIVGGAIDALEAAWRGLKALGYSAWSAGESVFGSLSGNALQLISARPYVLLSFNAGVFAITVVFCFTQEKLCQAFAEKLGKGNYNGEDYRQAGAWFLPRLRFLKHLRHLLMVLGVLITIALGSAFESRMTMTLFLASLSSIGIVAIFLTASSWAVVEYRLSFLADIIGQRMRTELPCDSWGHVLNTRTARDWLLSEKGISFLSLLAVPGLLDMSDRNRVWLDLRVAFMRHVGYDYEAPGARDELWGALSAITDKLRKTHYTSN